MSFILDALKKSETERQRQASAEFATVPVGNDSPGIPRWLWALGLLLAVNLAVLLGLFLRPESDPAVVAMPIVNVADAPAVTPSFAEQVEVARQNAPPRQAAPVTAESADDRPAEAAARATPLAPPSANSAVLPTFQQVIANGTVVLPDLHLDIHVYSATPEDRFVFINMSKQRERSQLSEGPVVTEITPDGVVLDYRGTRFLLPRD